VPPSSPPSSPPSEGAPAPTPPSEGGPTPPTLEPPTASFIYAPKTPVAGQPVLFNGTSSTCPGDPCTYEWSDDGSPTEPASPLWPLGVGQTLIFTFSEADTKYVRLVVTDASGQANAIVHNVVVEESEPPPTEPPPPAPPKNTALPTVSGSAVEGQTLSASKGTWTGSPTSYVYQWEDCNSSGASCSNISGATTSSYKLVAADVGHTLRAVVTASNAGGSKAASSAATATVTAPAPPPAAPKNTTLPSVSGTPQVGQTLSASSGTWSGSPTSYAYQWQDCNSSGVSCSSVGGAMMSSYKLVTGDVGHAMRVVVTASNAGGSTPSSSAATATVTSGGTDPEEPSLSAKGCFENPETEGTSRIEACGYPGEHNTGVEKNALEKGLHEEAGTIRLTGEEHYEDKKLSGSIIIAWNAKNVVIKNDEIISNGLCSPSPPYSIANGCTGNAIEFERESDSNDEAAKGTLISHVKVGGAEVKGPNTVQTCIDARWNSPYIAEYVNTEYCSGFKLNGGGELNHDYCPSNYEIEEEHYECVTDEGEALAKAPLVIKDSTIFTPQTTTITAAVFLQGLYGSIQEVRMEDNLMAGGNYIIDGGEEAGQDKLVGPLLVTDNRFARCRASACPDSHGYWEEGGQYKVQAFTNEKLTTWSHNFWDDNLEECVYGVGACY